MSASNRMASIRRPSVDVLRARFRKALNDFDEHGDRHMLLRAWRARDAAGHISLKLRRTRHLGESFNAPDDLDRVRRVRFPYLFDGTGWGERPDGSWWTDRERWCRVREGNTFRLRRLRTISSRFADFWADVEEEPIQPTKRFRFRGRA